MITPGVLLNQQISPIKPISDNSKTLENYFRRNKWEFDWDFSAKDNTCWYNLYHNGKILIQVEIDCSPDQVEKDLKGCASKYDGALKSIFEELKGQYLYIRKD